MFAAALLFSALGLLVGPVLGTLAQGRQGILAALDGATLGIVPALILLRLLPHLVEETGVWAVGALVLGYVLFLGVEARTHRRAVDVGLTIVFPSLALHGFLDGAALSLAFPHSAAVGSESMAIGVALIVHKVPEGLFIASILLPSIGRRATAFRFVLLVATMVLGALCGHELLAHVSDQLLHLVVAVGLGVMLRMVLHRHESAPPTRREDIMCGIAFVTCLATMLIIPDPRHLLARAQPGELSAAQTLVPLLLETAPMLLVAVAIGEARARWFPDQHVPDRLPGMGLANVALSWTWLGTGFTVIRALLEPLLLLLVRWHASRNEQGTTIVRAREVWLLVASAMPPASAVLPSYAIGVAMAMVAEATLPRHVLGELGWGTIPLVLLAAAVVRPGTAGVTVLAALLVHKGAPAAAALLFSLLAAWPGFEGRFWTASRFTHTTIVACFLLALLGVALPVDHDRYLHHLAAHEHDALEWTTGAVLAFWAVGSLVWSGPRAWFRAFLEPHHEHVHAKEHHGIYLQLSCKL